MLTKEHKKDLAITIADKLQDEGLSKLNYDRDKAIEILNRCVSKSVLTSVLVEYENAIKEELK